MNQTFTIFYFDLSSYISSDQIWNILCNGFISVQFNVYINCRFFSEAQTWNSRVWLSDSTRVYKNECFIMAGSRIVQLKKCDISDLKYKSNPHVWEKDLYCSRLGNAYLFRLTRLDRTHIRLLKLATKRCTEVN